MKKISGKSEIWVLSLFGQLRFRPSVGWRQKKSQEIINLGTFLVWTVTFSAVRWLVAEKIPDANKGFECERPYEELRILLRYQFEKMFCEEEAEDIMPVPRPAQVTRKADHAPLKKDNTNPVHLHCASCHRRRGTTLTFII